MRRRMLTVAGVLALLVPTLVPVVGACPLEPSVPHGCCASRDAPAAEAESTSCCGDLLEGSPQEPPNPSAYEPGCDCIHSPMTPAADVVGPPSFGGDQVGVTQLITHPWLRSPFEPAQLRIDHASLGGRHPPIFLLNSSFLT